LLKIRRFVQGKDDEDWVRVWNEAFKEYEEMRQMTVEEFRTFQKSPDYNPEGRFIAESNGQPIGIVQAYVDKLRSDKKGFVRSFGVVPEFRGRGFEAKLAQMAIQELKKCGMDTVQAGATDSREDIMRLWESLGFKLVREFSLMKRDLKGIPADIGENREVMLTPLRKESDEDLRMLNWLDNECFKEHFNWRPSPVERTVFFVREDPFFNVQEWYFAVLGGQHVGYVGVGVDKRYNVERNALCGWILDIGVLKPHRRTGVGTRLMLQGMERLKAMGMTSVMLGVDDWNVTKAIKLYEKVGFKVDKKDFAYERSIE
jgi:ribosomal protein S18 acetylase RimI-like enzyme